MDASGDHTCSYEEVQKIATMLQSHTKFRPKLGIICGSGLGTLVDLVEHKDVISYESIPGFPKSTVPGHHGNFVFGELRGKPVCLMQGRVHPYEGYSTKQCTLPVRVMKLLGIETLFLTNAAGGLNPSFNVGDVMIMKDHINFPGLTGFNPLCGPNDDRWGVRFLALSNLYDRELLKLARETAHELHFDGFLREGVYAMQWGPCYETVAECKLMLTLGADCVGMSTVHEAIVAHHTGMRVLALSLITNKAVLSYDSTTAPACHAEVLQTSAARAEDMKQLIARITEKFLSV